MPTYQYECDNCSHVFDIMQSIVEKKLKKCPQCNQLTLQRLIGSGGGIVFKGSGYYETDYKKKSSGEKACPLDSSKECSKSCPAKDAG